MPIASRQQRPQHPAQHRLRPTHRRQQQRQRKKTAPRQSCPAGSASPRRVAEATVPASALSFAFTLTQSRPHAPHSYRAPHSAPLIHSPHRATDIDRRYPWPRPSRLYLPSHPSSSGIRLDSQTHSLALPRLRCSLRIHHQWKSSSPSDYPLFHAYRLQIIADRYLLLPHALFGTPCPAQRPAPVLGPPSPPVPHFPPHPWTRLRDLRSNRCTTCDHHQSRSCSLSLAPVFRPSRGSSAPSRLPHRTQPPHRAAPPMDGPLLRRHLHLHLPPHPQHLAPLTGTLTDATNVLIIVATTFGSILLCDLGLQLARTHHAPRLSTAMRSWNYESSRHLPSAPTLDTSRVRARPSLTPPTSAASASPHASERPRAPHATIATARPIRPSTASTPPPASQHPRLAHEHRRPP